MIAHETVNVVGAGIAGLTLGRALRSRGAQVVLYEKKRAAARHQHSLTLYPWAYEALLRILDIDIATFRQRVAVGETRTTTAEKDRASPVPVFRVNQGKLEDLLAEGLQIENDHILEHAQRLDGQGGIELSFCDRPRLRSSCTVAADGPLSPMRRFLAPDCQLKVHPFVAIYGKRRVNQDQYKSGISMFPAGVEFRETKRDDVLLQAYVNDYAENELSMSYTYSRPPNTPHDPLYKPNRPASRATDIPEEYYLELENINKGLSQPFKTIFEPDEVRSSQSFHWLMRSAMVSRKDVICLAKQNIFMIGDALHAMPILGSIGANIAIKDAIELAECLSLGSSVGDFYGVRYDGWQKEVKAGEKRLEVMHQSNKPSL